MSVVINGTNGVTYNDGTIQATAPAQKNKIINGNFAINQRGVSGTVSLSAGAYGHDRFKAGSSGCTYTFATSANVTTITITAGSLQQVIEGVNLQSGTHVLSWTGTAQAKIDSGSYADTGVTATLTGGTNATVEFGTGTVTKAQLEAGTTATPFENLQFTNQLQLCQRYYYKSYAQNSGTVPLTSSGWIGSRHGIAYATNNIGMDVRYPVIMRASPTVTIYHQDGTTPNVYEIHTGVKRAVTGVQYGNDSGVWNITASVADLGVTAHYYFQMTAIAEL